MLTSDLFPCLWTGQTFAVFHAVVNTPFSSNLLNNIDRGFARVCEQFFSTQLPIPSGPVDLCGLNKDNSFSTSVSLVWTISTLLSVLKVKTGNLGGSPTTSFHEIVSDTL